MTNMTLSQALTRSLPSTSSESDNEFLESCQANALLADLDDDLMPDIDNDGDENDDENEDDDFDDVVMVNLNFLLFLIKSFMRQN